MQTTIALHHLHIAAHNINTTYTTASHPAWRCRGGCDAVVYVVLMLCAAMWRWCNAVVVCIHLLDVLMILSCSLSRSVSLSVCSDLCSCPFSCPTLLSFYTNLVCGMYIIFGTHTRAFILCSCSLVCLMLFKFFLNWFSLLKEIEFRNTNSHTLSSWISFCCSY